MKLGYIDYLNCYPLYHHMFTHQPLEGVEIHAARPGDLNDMMEEGTLDMSPISAAAFPAIQKRARLVPDVCLSSVGYVRSVVLYSHLPIEELHTRRVGLTSASKTSVNLLKILLEKYYGVRPLYETVPPLPSLKGIDAALVIGNEAMVDTDEPARYVYDLGDLWMRRTGYPVVFAVYAASDEICRTEPEKVRRVTDSYRTSLAMLDTHQDEVIDAAAARYPDIRFDIRRYYELIKYRFTDQMKEALMFYFGEAAELGLLDPVTDITWIE